MPRTAGAEGLSPAMAGHARLRKYQIRHAPEGWWGRVPYGSWRWYETWDLAVLDLSIRHEARRLKVEKRARRACSESASND